VNSGAADFYKPAVPLKNALYKNNRDGTFTDVTEKAGVAGGQAFGMGCAVADYDDLPENRESLAPTATRVRELFDRVGRAARTLSDDHDPLPPLPDEPDVLSFGIAALIDMDVGRRQELLISRLASGRLTTIEELLSSAVESLEARARVHGRAKSNGRGPYASA